MAGMNIFVLSDTHLEHGTKVRACDLPSADIMVLAGDIGYLNEESTLSFLRAVTEKYEHVLFVPGNHEYWGRMTDAQMQGVCADIGIIMLQNETATINGVVFAGSTMWSDLRGVTSLAVAQQNDFKYHPGLDTVKWSAMFDKAMQFLSSAKADVVITHHAPLMRAIPNQFQGDPSNGLYATRVLLKHMPKVWCYGHTHHPFREKVHNTVFISNPMIDVEYQPRDHALGKFGVFEVYTKNTKNAVRAEEEEDDE